MNDDRLLLEMRSWLQEEHVTLPDAEKAARQVVERLPASKQRRRWGRPPFLARTRRSRSTVDPTIEYRPTRIAGSNGPATTVIGRTQTMLSPAKAIVTGALIFAIGGVLLLAQPSPQRTSLPGVDAGVPAELAPFTARYSFTTARPAVRTTLPDGTPRAADAAWVFRSVEASDPRFEGNLIVNATTDTYDGVSLTTHVQRIENDAGAWQEGPYLRMTWTGRDTPGDEEVVAGEARQQYFIGEGEYDGLVAIVVSTEEVSGGGSTLIEGYIVDGELPPLPDPFSPES